MNKLIPKFLNPSGPLYYYTSPYASRYNTILREDGAPVPIRTSKDPEADLYATFPDIVVTAPYTGNKRVVKVKDKNDLTTHKINEARLKFGESYVKPVGYMMLAAPAAALTGAGVSAAGGWGAVGNTVWNHFVVPAALNEVSNTVLKKLFNTTLTELGSNFLQKNLGFNKFWGDFGGSFLEPTNYITGEGIVNALTNDGSRQAFLNTALNTVRNAATTWKPGDTWLPLKGSRTPTTESNTLVGNWLKEHPNIRYAVSPEFRAKIGYYSLYHKITPKSLYRPEERAQFENLQAAYKRADNYQVSVENLATRLEARKELQSARDRINDLVKKVQSDLPQPTLSNKMYTYVDEFGNSTTANIPHFTAEEWGILYPATFDLYEKHKSIIPYIDVIKFNTTRTLMGQQPESLMSAISSRNARLTNLIGDNGYLGGSSSLTGSGRIVGVPGDDDIITTASRYPNLIKSLEGLEIESLHNVHGYRVESPHFRVNDKGNRQADIDVLEEDTNGYAKGLVAHQIFSYFYPKEYRALREAYVFPEGYKDYNRKRTIDFVLQSLPIKTESLFQVAKKDPEWVAINDMIWSPLDKHNSRTRSALMQPLNLDILNKALDTKSISLFGEVKDLPKDFNLNNIEANKVFLRALGLDENLATNPDMMKAIARYYYYSAGSSTRVVVPNLITRYFPKQETFEGFQDQVRAARVAMEPKNGSSSGRGINTTLGPHGAGTDSFLGETTLYLTKLNDTVKDPETLYNLVSLRNKVTKEQAALLNELFKTTAFEEGNDYLKVLLYFPYQQTAAENIAIGNILGVDRILGGRYRGSNIYGNTDFRYAGGFDPNPENTAHIWSKSGIAHGSISHLAAGRKPISHRYYYIPWIRDSNKTALGRFINRFYNKNKLIKGYDTLVRYYLPEARRKSYKASSALWEYESALNEKYRSQVSRLLKRRNELEGKVLGAHLNTADNWRNAATFGAATSPFVTGGYWWMHHDMEKHSDRYNHLNKWKDFYKKYKNLKFIPVKDFSNEQYDDYLKFFDGDYTERDGESYILNIFYRKRRKLRKHIIVL